MTNVHVVSPYASLILSSLQLCETGPSFRFTLYGTGLLGKTKSALELLTCPPIPLLLHLCRHVMKENPSARCLLQNP